MGIGRNEQCPCGSGKKYKKCCLNKEESFQLDESISIQRQLDLHMNQSRVKQCVHPRQDECSEKIIKAHSIQNNKILTKISRQGEVYMIRPELEGHNFVFDKTSKGRRVATTFTGFCGYHDKTTFQDIEDRDYDGDEKQKFLYAYRAYAREYHTKIEAMGSVQKIFSMRPELLKVPEFVQQYRGYQASLEVDHHYYKNLFDKGILDEKYDVLETIELVYDGEVGIAVNAAFFLEYDIEGNRLNDITSLDTSERLKLMTYNLFPQNGKTFVLVSWLEEDANFYSDFKSQLLNQTKEEQLDYFNNLIPWYFENFVINPDLWDSFNPSQKDEILQKYVEDFTILRFSQKQYIRKPTSYDFFSNCR